MHFVYILQSSQSGRFYVGSSADPEKRLASHNRGATRSTKPYRPWMLIYSEVHPDKSTAEKREWFLKHPSGYLEKRKIVEQCKENKGGVA